MSNMGTQNLVLLLLVGVVAGFAAGKIMKGAGFGLLGDLVVGVAGAFVGVWVLGMLGIATGGLFGLLLAAIAGALLLLFLVRLIKRR